MTKTYCYVLTTSKISHEKEKLVVLILIDESMHVIYLDNAHIKLKLVHSKVPMFQKKFRDWSAALHRGSLHLGPNPLLDLLDRQLAKWEIVEEGWLKDFWEGVDMSDH